MGVNRLTDWNSLDYSAPDYWNAEKMGATKQQVAYQRKKRGWPKPIFWTKTRIWWHTQVDWRKPNTQLTKELGFDLNTLGEWRRKIERDRERYANAGKPFRIPAQPYITHWQEVQKQAGGTGDL